MLKRTFYANRLLFCLFCQLSGYACAQVHSPAAVRSVDASETTRAQIAAGRATPLDALTPYGKREAIRQLQWREDTLIGFGFAPLIRELDHDQLASVLRFLESANYFAMLKKKLVGSALKLPAPSAQVERNLHVLRQFVDEDRHRRNETMAAATPIGSPAILRRYKELFSVSLQSNTLKSLPLGDLLPLFDASTLAASGEPGSAALDDMLRVHDEFTARGVDTRRTLDDAVLYAMLAGRRFSRARAFVATRPHLSGSTIPGVVDTLGTGYRGRSVFQFDASRNQLTRLPFPSPQGRELVMVVGTGCQSSARALQGIRDDVELQKRLRQANIVLITAPDSPVDTHLMAEWNAAHPDMEIRAPYNVLEWNAIKVTGIPSFYILEKDRVVRQHTGWSVDGKAELEKLIAASTE